jgi:hypothetical protein
MEINLNSLLPGYFSAVEELGILTKSYPGWYRIHENFILDLMGETQPKELERIKVIEREIQDVGARYLTHRRAGNSDCDLVIKAVISKVKREVHLFKERGIKSSLEDPKKFLIYSK